MISQPLKILMTDPHLRGGGQVRYVGNLARELTAMGHDVTIGCKPGSVLVDRAREAGCGVADRFAFRSGLRPEWRRDILEARRCLLYDMPDIVHVSGSQDHWLFGGVNRLLGYATCLVRTRHNTYAVKSGLPNRILNRRWTDVQIVVCQTVCDDLARHPAFDAQRLFPIHNGVDAKLFKPDADARQKIREEFGYGENHVVCGIVARLVPAKGHDFLFQAVAQLKDRRPELRVLVLGQGDREAELQRLCADLDIAPLVRFAGFRDDMAACVQAIDIGAQPSVDCDTSSFSLKEQMAAEKPVVASDYGGLTEIVDDGVEGIVVPAGTVEPLADALERLLGDPELRAHMGVAGRRRVLRDFTVHAFASRTVEAYRRALEIHRERFAH